MRKRNAQVVKLEFLGMLKKAVLCFFKKTALQPVDISFFKQLVPRQTSSNGTYAG